ncbi:hypothetical protein GCM10010341_86930 [Streptomyces noursei]|nr:hypothetical protein GCM10010341_86930 [Streptomyces noursei]
MPIRTRREFKGLEVLPSLWGRAYCSGPLQYRVTEVVYAMGVTQGPRTHTAIRTCPVDHAKITDAIAGDLAAVVDVVDRLEPGGTETPNGRAVS